jgi:hypothetical protein
MYFASTTAASREGLNEMVGSAVLSAGEAGEVGSIVHNQVLVACTTTIVPKYDDRRIMIAS